jgi:hypothetical protein
LAAGIDGSIVGLSFAKLRSAKDKELSLKVKYQSQ